MKPSTTAYALAASLIPFAFASPLHVQRQAHDDVVVVTDVQTAVTTAEVVVTAGSAAESPAQNFAAPSQAAESTAAAAPAADSKHNHYNYHSHADSSAAPSPTSTAAPAPPPATTTWAPPPPATTSAAATTAGSGSTTADPSMVTPVLNSTNQWRHEYGASDLTWNDSLASSAQDTANGCLWSHTNAGQNFEGGGDPSISGAIDSWGHEFHQYPWSAPAFTEDSGHFSQLVWKNTTSVGCAQNQCGDSGNPNDGRDKGWFFVCNYWPVGNIDGEYADNVGTQGS